MGYWPSVRSRWLDIGQVLFLCVYGLRQSRGPSAHKKTRQIQTWSIKDLLYGFRGSPERARWLHLARSGSQSQRAIWVISPACGASHITIYDLPLFCADLLRFKHQLRSLTFWSTSSPIESNHVNVLKFVGLIYFCSQISPFPFDKN